MRNNNRSNILLVEILIAVLFFMLSATVLMRVFVTARNMTVRSGVEAAALTDAQRGQMEKLRHMELFFNAETHAGDALALYRLEDAEAVTVAVCQEGEPRPAFAARLLF